MMSAIKKCVSLALALLFVFCLSACSPTNQEEPEKTESATTAATKEDLILCEGAKSDYVVVTPTNGSLIVGESASEITSAMNREFGVFIRCCDDLTPIGEKEIVVGITNRYTPSEKLEANQYVIKVEGSSVMIIGGCDKALRIAVNQFVTDFIKKDANGNLSIPKDLSINRTIDAELVEDIVVTVATFNIANGREVDHNFEILAEDIKASGADIVALQEVDMFSNRNGMQDTMQILADEAGFDYYEFGFATEQDVGKYGNGILSKYPIVDAEVIKLPKGDPNDSSEEPRSLLHVTVEIEEGLEVDCFVTHIQGPSAKVQFQAINEVISEYDSIILAADFNQEPSEEIFSIFENTYIVNTKDDDLVTTRVGYDFDNIVFRTGMIAQNTEVINTDHSDHLMLITEWVAK